MPLPLEKSIKGESGGADSGFSSRNSVSNPRQDEEMDESRETARLALAVDGDVAMTEDKSSRTCDGVYSCVYITVVIVFVTDSSFPTQW